MKWKMAGVSTCFSAFQKLAIISLSQTKFIKKDYRLISLVTGFSFRRSATVKTGGLSLSFSSEVKIC